MSEFKREHRYLVLKLSDMGMHLPGKEIQYLQNVGEDLDRARVELEGKEPLGCVVVESDWPEYETVWAMIQARVEGKPDELTTLRARVQELEAVYKHARGLCFGVDWNNGTAADHHRKALIAAVNAVDVLPTPPQQESQND